MVGYSSHVYEQMNDFIFFHHAFEPQLDHLVFTQEIKFITENIWVLLDQNASIMRFNESPPIKLAC